MKRSVIITAVAATMFVASAMLITVSNRNKAKDNENNVTTDCETVIDSSCADSSDTGIIFEVSSLKESSLKDSSVTLSGSSESSGSIEICNSENVQNETQIASPIETAPVTYANEYANNDVFEYTEPVTTTTVITEEISADEPVVEYTDATYAPSDLYTQGRLYYGDYQYTWYSERVLPGYGLAIDGRHTDDKGFVCDGDGYICVASGSLEKGTVVDTPFGREGRVYDCGCPSNVLDIYVNW